MEKVYVLGAGSSHVAGAPLVRDFKKRATELSQRGNGERNPRMAETIKFWDRTAQDADIEEFYILADLLDRLEAVHQSQGAANGVRYLIAKTLELSMGSEISEAHRNFVHKVWDLSSSQENQFLVITLNWDIAVDNASYTHDQFSLDYGYEKARSFGDDSTKRDRRFRLLKLHGSLNWWVCQQVDCQTLWHRRGAKDVAQYWDQTTPHLRCAACGTALIPLMVPPTGQKFEFPGSVLSPMRTIWKQAREGLRNCRDLAIVGYSFPRTDVQFKMFLLEALSRNETLRNILVVSEPKIGSRRQRFEDSYDDVFAQSHHRQRLKFVYSKFEDWVAHGMPF